MSFEIINGIIEKYFAGETSLEEEKVLRGYFNGSTIDPRLASYAPLFQFFEKEKQVVFDAAKLLKFDTIKTLHVKKQPFEFKILRGGNFWKIAATVAFLVVGSVAIFKTFEKPQNPVMAQNSLAAKHPNGAKFIILDDAADEQEAMEQVNAALALVSKKMKKGTDKTNEGLLKLRDATEILNDKN